MAKIKRRERLGAMDFGGSPMKNEITPGLWLLIAIGAVLFVFTMGCGCAQALMTFGLV